MTLAELSDARLVARCRTGEQDAWRELVTRFSRYVYAIATQAFRLSEHDAEDVFQEVFARTYEHLDRLREDEAIRPWIAQLTRRLCVDRLRSATREQPSGEELEPPGFDDTLALPSGTIASRISRCLGKLREKFEGRSEGLPSS